MCAYSQAISNLYLYVYISLTISTKNDIGYLKIVRTHEMNLDWRLSAIGARMYKDVNNMCESAIW